MKKPIGYEETPVSGEFTPVELGGHKAVILQVSEKQSSTGKPMLVVSFDFDKDDAQAGYFKQKFDEDDRADKKWPNQATKYILAEDKDGKCSKALKTFCTCVKNSNPGFDCWKGEEFDAKGIKGKKVGCVFGEEMDYYNGKEIRKRVIRFWCSIDKVADQKVPDMSETNAYKEFKESAGSSSASDGFMNIPDSIDEDLPFS